jgi:hypothetical protein
MLKSCKNGNYVKNFTQICPSISIIKVQKMNKFSVKLGFLACLGLFSNNMISAQSTDRAAPKSPDQAAEVTKKDTKMVMPATLTGKPAPETAEIAPVKATNDGTIRKMTPAELNPPPPDPNEKPAEPIKYGPNNRPANGTKTVVSKPVQRPVHPKPTNTTPQEWLPKN